MKNTFLILLVVISINSFSQKNDEAEKRAKIPKGTSTILVKKVTFDAIVNELIKQGYKIDYKVENVIVRTKHKKVTGPFNPIRLHIRYADSTAQIMGTLGYTNTNPITKNFQRNYYYQPMETVITTKNYKRLFQAVNDFALALGEEISYEK